jgi:FKBP-type peptidyl-prolyl cis-trans isomerase
MENKKNMNIILAVVICIALIGVLIFISIRNKTNMPSNDNVNNIASNPINIGDNNTAGTPTKSTNETGEVVKAGDTVAVYYTGKLANGTVFDASSKHLDKDGKMTPLVFTVGAGQMIPGFDKGIVGMKIGEKKTLVLPPEEAYGANGISGMIPPNATLTFEVELLAIKK